MSMIKTIEHAKWICTIGEHVSADRKLHLYWSNGRMDWPGFSTGGLQRGYWYGSDMSHSYLGTSKDEALETIRRNANVLDREIVWSDKKKTKYTCDGSVRGTCGVRHHSLGAAQRCCDKDHRACHSTGGYSDRIVKYADLTTLSEDDRTRLYELSR